MVFFLTKNPSESEKCSDGFFINWSLFWSLYSFTIKKRPSTNVERRIFTGDPGQIRTADLPLRSFNNVKTNAFICNISSFCAEIYHLKCVFCKLFRMFSIHSIRISPFFVLRFFDYFLYLQSV